MFFKYLVFFMLVAAAIAENKCGTTYTNSACGTSCPRGLDSECPSGQSCWGNAPVCTASPPSNTPRCGTTYSVSGCGTTCPNGIDSQCPSGQRCWADPPSCTGPVPSPVPEPNPTSFPTRYPTTGGGGDSGSCNVGQSSGTCKSVSACNGISVAGYCSGSSSVQCCVLEPISSTVMHLPDRPSTSGNVGSCQSIQNSFSGICVSTSSCTGATFNDVCAGGSSYKCCVAETEAVPDILRDQRLSQEVDHLDLLSFSAFRSLFTGISSTRAEALFPYYNYALAEVLLDAGSGSESCYRSAAFAAQVGHESVGLLYFEEIASGAAYEGREDLGNIYPGDGPRFKGRGPIQLTGRYNYQSAGSRLGEDLEGVPDRVCFPNMGFLTTVDYWMSRNLNRYAGSSSESDFITLTRLINGGTNGLTDRQNRWYAARRLLGCDSLVREGDSDQQFSTAISTKVVGGSILILAVITLVGGLYGFSKKKKVVEAGVGAGELVNANVKKVENPMYL